MVRVEVGLPLPTVGCEKVAVAPAGRPLETLRVDVAEVAGGGGEGEGEGCEDLRRPW